MTDPTTWLERHSQSGDLLLTGSGGLIGNLIQRATRNAYSHAAVIRDGQLVEAYEYGLTPNENDEGVYVTTFAEIVERNENLRLLTLRRPIGMDLERYRAAADHYVRVNPTFASIGLCLIGVWQAMNVGVDASSVAVGLSSDRLLQLLRFQANLTGDGDGRVHCAELATRIYTKAGLSLSFTSPTLAPLLAALAAGEGVPASDAVEIEGQVWVHPADDDQPVRISRRGRWTGWRDVVDIVGALRARYRQDAPPDMADFIVPGDFQCAEPFRTVATLLLVDDRWEEMPEAEL